MQESDRDGSEAEGSDEDEDTEAKAERLGRRLAPNQNQSEQPHTSGRQAADARVRTAVAEGRGTQGTQKRGGSKDGSREVDTDEGGRLCATEGPIAVEGDKQTRRKQAAGGSGSDRGQIEATGSEGAAAFSGSGRGVLAAVAQQQREQLLSARPGATQFPHTRLLVIGAEYDQSAMR